MITKPRHIVLAVSAAVLLSVVAMPASANPGKWTAHAQQSRAHQSYVLPTQAIPSRSYRAKSQGFIQSAQSDISAAEAKSIARRQVKGSKFVDIFRKGNTYRVRVIAKNGKVVDVYIDANTGRVKRR